MKRAAPAEDSGRPAKKDCKHDYPTSAEDRPEYSLTYTLDPAGDTFFVVRNVPEHLPHDFQNLSADRLSGLSDVANTPASLSQRTDQLLCVRASCKHLTLASQYFEKMFSGSFREASNLQSHGYVELAVADWDARALLIFLLIVHGRTRLIPRKISLEMLCNLAILADYYGCYEPLEVFSDIWIHDLASTIPTAYNKHSQQWLFISWVFQKREIFAKVTLAIQETSTDVITAGNLPVPHPIIDALNEGRYGRLQSIIQSIRHLFRRLSSGQDPCLSLRGESPDLHCTYVVLGALTRQMTSLRLFRRNKHPPYSGFAVNELTAACKRMKSPLYCSTKCRLPARIATFLDLEPRPSGLEMETFRNQMPGGMPTMESTVAQPSHDPKVYSGTPS